jgi:hypothetical protein
MRSVSALGDLLLVAAVAAAWSCSACSSSSSDGSAAQDGGGPADGAAHDGGTAADGAAQDGGTPADAPAQEDSGPSGAPQKLFPLAVGYRWTYDVQPVGAGSTCASGTTMQEVTGTRMVDGKQAFDLVSFCAAAGTSEVAPVGAGDEVDLDYQGTWLVMIDPTLVDGHSWPYFNSGYTWHKEASVTVPAGTFTDCWTAKQNVSYTATLTYCRGVGMVRSYSSDLNGSGWDAQLTGKSF